MGGIHRPTHGRIKKGWLRLNRAMTEKEARLVKKHALKPMMKKTKSTGVA